MKNLNYLLLFGLLTCFSTGMFAQVSGTVNIPGNYPDLDAAITALNTQGVGAGGATVNINASQTCPSLGYQLGSATLNASLSATSPLVINGNNNTITAYVGSRAGNVSNGSNDGMLMLNGVDYTTVQNIIFNDLPTNTTATTAMETAIALYNLNSTPGSADGCEHIEIKNCTVNFGNFATFGGAFLMLPSIHNGASTIAWTAGSGDIHRNINIHDNNLASIYWGMNLRGATSAASAENVTVSNNTITNSGGGSATGYGIYASFIDGLTFTNNTLSGDVLQTGITYLAYGTSLTGDLKANNNTLTLQSGATTSGTYGMYLSSNGAREVNSNTVHFGSFPNITSGIIYALYSFGTPASDNISIEMNGNTINNETLPGTSGTVYLLYNTAAVGTNRDIFINNNTITNLSKTNSGTLYCIYAGTSSSTSVLNNTISNIEVTNNSASGSSSIYGVYGYVSPPIQIISNNIISGLKVTGTSTSTLGIIRGIMSGTIAAGTVVINDNTISDLSFQTGTTTGSVQGIYTSLASHDIYNNNIYNINASQAAGLVRGMEIISGPEVNIYNNFISGLTAPNANSNIAISGIHMTGGVNANVSYNTIYPSSGGALTSSAALFGAAGVYYSSTATNIATLKNNIINITGTAKGDAYVSALKRAGVGTNGTKPVNFFGTNNIYNAPYIHGEGPVLSTATNVYYVSGGSNGTADPTFNTSCGLYKTFMGETGTFSENNLTSLGSGLYVPSGSSYAQNNATTDTNPNITDDYNGVVRGTFPDVGALEFSGTVLDATGPIIEYDLLPNSVCTNKVHVKAEITDVNGVNTVSGTKPRVFFKKSTDNNSISGNTSASNGWKYVEASNNSSPFNFDIDFSIIFGGVVNSGDIIEYFVVAQDLYGTPNVGTQKANYPVGYCPTSVALPSAAFPVSNYNSFTIIPVPASITTVADKPSVCISDDVVLSLSGGVITGAEYQWQSSPKNANIWTNIPGATEITYTALGLNTSTDFRCIITCGGVPLSVSPSTLVSITVDNPQVLTTTDAVSCTPGPVSLTLFATGSSGSTLNWYADPVGGAILGTGGSYTTPPISSTTTYYVSAGSGVASVNVASPTIGTSTFITTTIGWGLRFTVNQTIGINNVTVRCSSTTPGAASIQIKVTDLTDAVLYTGTLHNFTITSTLQDYIIPVNISGIAPGNYKMQMTYTNITAMVRESGGVTFPYCSPSNEVCITAGANGAGTAQTTASYYWFYNWVISVGCESERVPVVAAIVTAPPTCPSDTSVCLSSPSFSLNKALPDGGTYSGTGVSANVFYPNVAGVGNHLITYTICGYTCTYHINVVNYTPTISIVENSGALPNDGVICGGDNATLTASASSGYLWSTGATTQSITVSSVGTYTVTATNAQGCTGTASAVISLSPVPTTSFTVTEPTTCLSTNGAIVLNISPAGSYTYAWSNGATTKNISNVGVGDYVVTITDPNGCDQVRMQSLVGPGGCNVCPTVAGNIVFSPTNGCVNTNFTATVDDLQNMTNTYGIIFKYFSAPTMNPYSGGTVFATVANGDLVNSGTTATGTGSIPSAGTYYIYAILDPNSPDPTCRPFASGTRVINVLPNAGMNISENSGLSNNDGIICQGASATLTGTGGGSYVWSTGATTSSITVTTAGTYTVTVTSTSGCSATASRTITVNPLPVPVINITETSGTNANDGNICQGASAVLTCPTTGTYVWSTGATTSGITVTTAGAYTVTVTNANGCKGTASVNIVVNPLPTPVIAVTESSLIPNDGTIIEGSNAILTASGGTSYKWSTNATTASITVAPLVTTTYTVTVTNANGCSATASQIITVVPPPCYIVCYGDQRVELSPGSCEYELPNLVTTVDQCAIYKIVQTKGPVAGTKLAPGEYELKFELRRKNNELVVDSCKLKVTVVGFSNPVRSLTCNDHVNVSIDDNCKVTLNADMFLEGGPYDCYWNYQINIWPFHFQGNAMNNIPQGVGLDLPFGNHTYEIIDPATGNRCWGTFTVEDKLPPVISCKCVDEPVITPVTNFTGIINDPDVTLEVSTTSTTCLKTTTANRQHPYAFIKSITVTVTGTYTFTKVATYLGGGTVNSNFSYMYIYDGPPNPNDLCQNFVTASSAATWSVTLTAGVQYYFVFAGAYLEQELSYDIDITTTSGGQVLNITNASDAPECQFKCYDLDVVKNETVNMLLGNDPNKAKLSTPPAFNDCGPVTAEFVDDLVSIDNCGKTKLNRTWTVTDGNGNSASCIQTFTFNQLEIKDLTPPIEEVHMTCGSDTDPASVSAFFDIDSRTGNASSTNVGPFFDDYGQTPYVVELNEGFKYGVFNYKQIGYDGKYHDQNASPSVCNIYITYTDDMFPACGLGCGGNMKVLRTWKLLDWCTKEVVEYTQIIKAADEKAPTFDVMDVTVSVDPWECFATWDVVQPWELQDNCAKPEELKWGVKAPRGTVLTGKQPNYRIQGLSKGVHSITYWAEDCCGNYTQKSVFIRVVDATAPVATAKQNIVLSLTGSGSNNDGIAKLFGYQVDNGSYDQCTDIRYELRRLGASVPACQNIGKDGKYNNNLTFNDHNGLTSATPGVSWLHPEDNVNDSDEGDYVKFCCTDIPQGEEFGIHQVELRVWDDGNMNGIIGDNDIVDGLKDNYNTTWADIRVENKIPPQIVCPPDVTVTCDMVLNLSIGVDTWIDTVNLTMTGYPKSISVCNGSKITYKDAGNLDDCNRGTITRTFTATIGNKTATCTQKITVGYIQVPFTVTFPSEGQLSQWDKCSFDLTDARNSSDPKIKKPIVNYGQCDIVGESIKIDTFLFEDGACKKWKVSYTYKNWCTGEEKGPYVYYYAFKDEIAPVIVCEDKVFPAVPPSPQNPLGGCEGSVVLTSSASDALVCAEETWIKWQVFFDGWSNGTTDRLGSSFVNKAWKDRWEKVDRLINGAPNPVWTALQAQHPGVVLADPVYVTYIKPTKASGEEVKLPAFTLPAENIEHKILWKVTDGCGNVDQCNSTVKVVDQKAPTPYCVHISTAIMQTNPKMVELWAKDFDKGAFDNCTPQNKLYFTFDEIYPVFIRLNQEHYFKAKAGQKEGVDATLAEYNQGKAQKWIPSLRSSGKIWTSAGVTNIKVSVWDESWNTDFCEVELKILDNVGSRISGKIADENNAGLPEVEIIANANISEYPKVYLTDVNGNFGFDIYDDTELLPTRKGDDINGVSTLDLVYIQRHILGIESLNSPYKMIAADANNDKVISASDLSEIRKLILGIITKFRNNESWRFPTSRETLDPSNPFNYSEKVITKTDDFDKTYNFTAVKIGDVNNSAKVDDLDKRSETRSNDKVTLNVIDVKVNEGEIVRVPVTSDNFNNVSGFQYTMHLSGAELMGVEKGALNITESNIGNLGNGIVTMSYAGSEGVTLNEGEVLFTMVVRGEKATKVSEIFSLTSAVTKAESYNGDLKVGAINLEVRTAPVASIELYQNEPNPFKGQTTVSFMMPEAGAATLSVYDMTGKLVVTRSISAVKGLNSEVFTKDQLGVSGVMYYTLESGDFSATKKMIVIE